MTHFPIETNRRSAISAGVFLILALGIGSQTQAATTSIPDFAPNDHISWYPPGQKGDDYLPPRGGGPGPVTTPPNHPYIPNGGADFASSHPQYRIADLSNPILKPWVKAALKKANDAVLAGKVPFSARERCFPGGVPEFEIYRRVGPPMVYFIQTPKEVLILWRGDHQTRHIYLDVPHTQNPKPSWYGESVGHYDGNTLVVDTIGQNTKTFVDNYQTPHTAALHVIERFTLTDPKTMDIDIHVEDPGAFNMPWNALQHYVRFDTANIMDKGESICAENNVGYFDYDVVPLPHADKADF